MATPKFPSPSQSFHIELKKRINDYFENTGQASTGNLHLYTKALLLLTAFFGLYVHLVFFTPPVLWAVLECVLLGLVVAGIGFNIMHDGAHGSFSKYKWVNNIAAMTLNLIGGSSFMWNVKHNVIHHAYTNVDGVDDDIDIQPWMRMSTTQPKRVMHRYQHYYFWFLYAMLYIMWIFVLDYQKYFKQRIGGMPLKKMSLKDHFIFWSFKVAYLFLFIVLPIYIFWSFKVAYLFLFIVLPIYILGFVSWLVGFLIFSVVTGFIISIIFQLAHTVEHTSFPVPHEETGKLDDEWAIHQLKTTANFAPRNRFVSWMVGGLNFQIEHHLFPKISHVHYPALRKIIKQACAEFDVPYIEYRRMRQAVLSHILFLKQMGRA